MSCRVYKLLALFRNSKKIFKKSGQDCDLDLWHITLKFYEFQATVKIHVPAKFHQAKCSGLWVIVLTKRKKTITKTIQSVAIVRTVTISYFMTYLILLSLITVSAVLRLPLISLQSSVTTETRLMSVYNMQNTSSISHEKRVFRGFTVGTGDINYNS